MKQVAQMLGVELEEEFYIKGDDNKFKITNGGMCYSFRSTDMWAPISWALCYILNGRLEIIKKPKPILDDIEKEYLSHIIKPFKEKITCITKSSYENDKEYIYIEYREYSNIKYILDFPSFKKGTMYKGMELDKEYSLEDLGLNENWRKE